MERRSFSAYADCYHCHTAARMTLSSMSTASARLTMRTAVALRSFLCLVLVDMSLTPVSDDDKQYITNRPISQSLFTESLHMNPILLPGFTCNFSARDV